MLTREGNAQLITKLINLYPGLTEDRVRMKVVEHVGPIEFDYVNYETGLKEAIENGDIIQYNFYNKVSGNEYSVFFPKGTRIKI